MIDRDLIGTALTTAQPHRLSVGDYIVMNGKSCRVNSVKDVTTFPVRDLDWREKLYLFWLGFLHGLAAPARVCIRAWDWVVEKWENR